MQKSIYTLLVDELGTPRWSDCFIALKYLNEKAHLDLDFALNNFISYENAVEWHWNRKEDLAEAILLEVEKIENYLMNKNHLFWQFYDFSVIKKSPHILKWDFCTSKRCFYIKD